MGVEEILETLVAVPPPPPSPPMLAVADREEPPFSEAEAGGERVGGRVACEDPLALRVPAAKLSVEVFVGGVEGERKDAVAEGVEGREGVVREVGEEEGEAKELPLPPPPPPLL